MVLIIKADSKVKGHAENIFFRHALFSYCKLLTIYSKAVILLITYILMQLTE